MTKAINCNGQSIELPDWERILLATPNLVLFSNGLGASLVKKDTCEAVCFPKSDNDGIGRGYSQLGSIINLHAGETILTARKCDNTDTICITKKVVDPVGRVSNVLLDPFGENPENPWTKDPHSCGIGGQVSDAYCSKNFKQTLGLSLYKPEDIERLEKLLKTIKPEDIRTMQQFLATELASVASSLNNKGVKFTPQDLLDYLSGQANTDDTKEDYLIAFFTSQLKNYLELYSLELKDITSEDKKEGNPSLLGLAHALEKEISAKKEESYKQALNQFRLQQNEADYFAFFDNPFRDQNEKFDTSQLTRERMTEIEQLVIENKKNKGDSDMARIIRKNFKVTNTHEKIFIALDNFMQQTGQTWKFGDFDIIWNLITNPELSMPDLINSLPNFQQCNQKNK